MADHPFRPKKKKKHGSSHEPASMHNSSHDRLSQAGFSRIAGTPKFQRVMAEFKAGTLRSSSGARVTDVSQARAIAKSEVQQSLRRARGKT